MMLTKALEAKLVFEIILAYSYAFSGWGGAGKGVRHSRDRLVRQLAAWERNDGRKKVSANLSCEDESFQITLKIKTNGKKIN